MVVPDGTPPQHFLAFGQKRRPLRRVVHGTAQGARDLWPAELRSSFPADRQRLSQHFGSFRALAGVKENTSLHFESLRLEAPRAELSGKLHRTSQVVPYRAELARLMAGEGTQRFGQ